MATFGHYWAEVPLSEAIRAHEAGALIGDPTHLVLVPYYGFGNGMGVDWGEVLAAMSFVWQTLSTVSTAHTTYHLSQRLARLFRRRAEVEEEHHVSWRARGAMPADVHNVIKSRRAWTTRELASLMGCSDGEAEAFLAGKGFVWDPQEEAWRCSTRSDGESQLIDNLDELVLWADMAEESGQQRLKAHVRLMVEEYFRTGRAPTPLDLYFRNGS